MDKDWKEEIWSPGNAVVSADDESRDAVILHD